MKGKLPGTAPAPDTDVDVSTLRSIARFVVFVIRENPARVGWVVIVQVFAALAQGIGLLLLVPLLQNAGVGPSASSAGLVASVRSVFRAVGLRPTLGLMLIVYAGVVALAAALGAYQTILVARFSQEFVDLQRARLYQAMATTQWALLVGIRQSDTLTVLTVNAAWISQSTAAILNLGAALILIPVQLGVALQISPPVTGLAAVTGVALAVVVWPLVGLSRRLGREMVNNNRALLATVTGFLDGLKLAKVHGLESGHVARFDVAVRRSRRSMVTAAKVTALSTAFQVSLTAGLLAGLVYVAVTHLALPISDVLVLAFIFTRIVPQITAAQQSLQLAIQGLPAFAQLVSAREVCLAAQETPLGPDTDEVDGSPDVRFANVGFAYPSGGEKHDVLRNVSVNLVSQHTTALVGSSGAGKSTIADLAVGLLTPTTGEVTVAGRPLVGAHLKAWRAHVGMVTQETFLFHDTIRANLLWAQPAATDEDIAEALDAASAHQFVSRLPLGLDTVVGDRGAKLSGGERQRLALARALLRKPRFLVLDEATNSLDAEHEGAIRGALDALHGRMTILVIAHRLSTVSHADTIIVIDRGAVVETGTWGELTRRRDGRLRQLLEAGG